MQVFKLFALILIPSLLLTGCISKRPQAIDEGDQVVDIGDTLETTDPNNRFTLSLPAGYVLVLAQEDKDAGAALYGIAPVGQSQADMYLEDSPGTVESAIGLLVNVDQVTEQSREELTINGFSGTKLNVILASDPKSIIPYYFLSAGGRAYVFSLPNGKAFKYYKSIIDSFTLAN